MVLRLYKDSNFLYIILILRENILRQIYTIFGILLIEVVVWKQ